MGGGKVTIRINEKGEIELETRGMPGPVCLEEVNKLLEEIVAVTDVKKTDEYYMKPKVRTRQRAKEKVKQ